ncbi:hypothetical protein [Trichloromonas sp.]|uniref:hypothetical protein n=1 Tax=Trichloromonas sp. TaxID=3069249 RepID=UPI003D81A988
MKERLIAAHLLDQTDATPPELGILDAWKVLSRLGSPCRYGGKSVDGLYEYLVTNPQNSHTIATGKGSTIPAAICAAALAAREVNPAA